MESDEEVLLPYDPERSTVSAATFFYPQNLISNNLNMAIQAGEFECAIKLIKAGRDLNIPDNRGFTSLHVAVQSGNLDLLDLLLNHPTIDKNVRSHRGETPLLISLLEEISDAVVLELINSGCDIHIPNLEDITPLHLAVRRNNVEVARKLIQEGANVNAIDFDGHTPLHEAVMGTQYEALCLLLYYNASVNEFNFFHNVTPFMLALNSGVDTRIEKLLVDYVTDFNATDSEGTSTLCLALNSKSSTSNEILLRCGSDINMIEDIELCLSMSVNMKDSFCFKYIFSNVSHKKLVKQPLLLYAYIKNCGFSSIEFVNCLYLILSSTYASRFVSDSSINRALLAVLCQRFIDYKVDESDRLSIIYLLLTLGISLGSFDFITVYKYFGFSKEFEAIFLTNPEIKEDAFPNYCFNDSSYCVIPLILFDNAPNTEIYLRNFAVEMGPQCDSVEFLKIFTPNEEWRMILSGIGNFYNIDLIVQSLKGREVGSLVELCRNKIREFIINSSTSGDMFKTYNIIKSLPVPQIVKDILHLKRPLY